MKTAFGVKSRPEIRLPISVLATNVHEPTERDYSKLIKIIKYLNETKELVINKMAT